MIPSSLERIRSKKLLELSRLLIPTEKSRDNKLITTNQLFILAQTCQFLKKQRLWILLGSKP
ncbi:hypothetical protein LINPERHAP1_LOCUS28517 [Linum perenne]